MRNVQFLGLILCLFLSTSQLFSQATIGVKGGFTSAWPDYGDVVLPDDAETNVQGLNFSLLYYRNINRNLSIGIEPAFVKRGSACIPGWLPDFVADSKMVLNYVELPLMASGRLTLFESRISIFGKLGYGVSRLTSAFEHVVNRAPIEIPEKRKIALDGTDSWQLNKVDHGFYGNMGFSYELNNKNRVFVESAYYHGMRDVDRTTVSKNRSLSFNLGYAIRL